MRSLFVKLHQLSLPGQRFARMWRNDGLLDEAIHARHSGAMRSIEPGMTSYPWIAPRSLSSSAYSRDQVGTAMTFSGLINSRRGAP